MLPDTSIIQKYKNVLDIIVGCEIFEANSRNLTSPKYVNLVKRNRNLL